MRYFNEADKWQELLEKFSDKKKINKGIRFENLVKELLCKLFPERNIIRRKRLMTDRKIFGQLIVKTEDGGLNVRITTQI